MDTGECKTSCVFYVRLCPCVLHAIRRLSVLDVALKHVLQEGRDVCVGHIVGTQQTFAE